MASPQRLQQAGILYLLLINGEIFHPVIFQWFFNQMVIDFSASWCGPCRFIEPAFKSMASKFTDVVFVKIDVDELQVLVYLGVFYWCLFACFGDEFDEILI